MKIKSFLFSAFALLALVSCNSGTSVEDQTSVDNSQGTSVVEPSNVIPSSNAPVSTDVEETRTVSIVWKDVYSEQTTLSSYAKDGVTVTFSKAAGSSDPAYYNSTNFEAARLYAGNTMTVAGEDITQIEISYVSYTNKDGLFEVNTGALNTSNDRLSDVWTGKANSVTFTVTELQRRISSMVITLGGSGSSTVTPTPDPDNYTVASVAQDVAAALEEVAQEEEGVYYIIVAYEDAEITDSEAVFQLLDSDLPDYLTIASEVIEDSWEDGEAGYFVYYITPDESVILEMGTYMDGTDLVVQIAVFANSEL